MSLESAPAHVKLAVDLIQLLEENHIHPQLALDALEIIKADCENKLSQQQDKS